MTASYASFVLETTTSEGEDDYNLGGAVPGYQTFIGAVGNGAEVCYAIRAGSDFEVGMGVVTAGTPDVLSRDVILESSNGGSKVEWDDGEKRIWCALPIDQLVTKDSSGQINDSYLKNVLNGGVADRTLTAPPGSPTVGVLYIPAATATGAWVGQEGKLAWYDGTAWRFITPHEGMGIWVNDEDVMLVYSGSAWLVFSGGGGKICEGRLTLTSGTPVTISDVTGATTLYFAPFRGNQVALYNGSSWVMHTFTQMSIALGTLTSGRPYDVFLDYNGGTPQLAILAWTNDTTRATALALQDGVLVKTGDTEQRYLGTFYTTSTTTTEDSAHQRYLWNYYNRVSRSLKRVDPSSTWNYTTLTLRQANASADNEVRFVRGIDEDIVFCSLQGIASNSSANIAIILGIGLDSTIAADTNATIGLINTPGAGGRGQICAYYSGLPGIGKHRLTWLEASQASGTTTWNGDNTGLPAKSGMFGHLLA